MEGVVIEVPPLEFNFDLSTNIALVLGKKTKQSPIKFAESIKKLLLLSFDFRRPSAIGDRQIFPKQTISILTFIAENIKKKQFYFFQLQGQLFVKIFYIFSKLLVCTGQVINCFTGM